MKNKLFEILNILQSYKTSNKVELMQKYIIERLDKSYNTYENELKHSMDFLSAKHEKSLIKRMNKK